jgi:putative acetyltransferase
MTFSIRTERASDHEAIRAVVYAAFLGHPQHPTGSEPIEHRIVDALRSADALALSLVADSGGDLLGHIAFSPVRVAGTMCGWYGLGPVAVRPDSQRQGLGVALITDGLDRLRQMQAAGVVLVGEPDYYGRFGFRQVPDLTFPGVPPEYFLALSFDGAAPRGVVTYHDAFSIG